jgi:hypothetical protein
MEALTIAVIAVSNILCFMVGAKVGQTVAMGKTVELPSIDPVKAVREHKAKMEAYREQDRQDTIVQNIENYDGTSKGQKDVPWG